MTIQPDLFGDIPSPSPNQKEPRAPSAPALLPSRLNPKIAAQGYEKRAAIIEKIAADYEAEIRTWESRGDQDQAQDRRARADHLRGLAQRMRDERRPLA